MRAVVQRVKKTSLSVDGVLISEIEKGLVVYLGVEVADAEDKVEYLAKKIANMRIFEDGDGKMNLSVLDTRGEILSVSQFTLYGDASHGNRPSFSRAEKPDRAKILYDKFCKALEANGVKVKKGVFGADMQINQHNDGPVTIIIEK